MLSHNKPPLQIESSGLQRCNQKLVVRLLRKFFRGEGGYWQRLPFFLFPAANIPMMLDLEQLTS